MAVDKEMFNMFGHLLRIGNYVLPEKVDMMLTGGLGINGFRDRFRWIQEETEAVEKQLTKIVAKAKEKDYQDILDIINEEV